ncbi:MAG: hypothetical protein V3W34_06415 [Phycisphaerae bacterium]
MLYAALTFWLLFVVLAAWAVQQLWGGIVKPRVLNMILLPGTLVAQLGHVLGLLVTGATVSNTALYKEESGEPGTTQNAKPRIPIIGPMVIGLLPLLACAAAILLAARLLGDDALSATLSQAVPSTLPTSLDGAWQFLRDQVTMVEMLVESTAAAFPGTWQFWLLIYLVVCLTVRMAPFPGSFRGSLGAILLLGLLAAAIGLVSASWPTHVESFWRVLNLMVPTLMFLLLVSALVRGAVGLGKLVAGNG